MEINELKIAKKKKIKPKVISQKRLIKLTKLVRLNKKKEIKHKLPILKMKEGIPVLTPQTLKGE